MNDPKFLSGEEEVNENEHFFFKFFSDKAKRDAMKGIKKDKGITDEDGEELALEDAEVKDRLDNVNFGSMDSDEEEERFAMKLAEGLMQNAGNGQANFDDEDVDTAGWGSDFEDDLAAAEAAEEAAAEAEEVGGDGGAFEDSDSDSSDNGGALIGEDVLDENGMLITGAGEGLGDDVSDDVIDDSDSGSEKGSDEGESAFFNHLGDSDSDRDSGDDGDDGDVEVSKGERGKKEKKRKKGGEEEDIFADADADVFTNGGADDYWTERDRLMEESKKRSRDEVSGTNGEMGSSGKKKKKRTSRKK